MPAPRTLRVLFVCSRNRLRSPTAEHVVGTWSGIETASAGTNHDAETPISAELIDWADIVFTMERVHRKKLQTAFRTILGTKRIVCLDIPDRFAFMDPALVALIERKVPPHLGR